ncbi:EpsI family protein [Roseiarcus fermentans]|uniref:EpsI family protein n=1 Tax=Roseiarcus fermentans TaxID=1473586 RepID=A0A366F7K9_9HYPH|nr:exosortase-associated protein EpsI, B-type [Roseiarcus fermentans]RBP10607.1 EpsI family protein [Roseiarcus fermentans]
MARSMNVLLACVAMLAAAALAYVLTPSRLMARSHEAFDIDAHIPHAFGEWSALPGVQAIKPPPDGLEAEIYNQEVSRAFVDKQGRGIMLMIAYGESQSDRLQLHHPEVCYTAQGFRVTNPVTTAFAWDPSGKPIPLTRLVATREGRTEPIAYWMRIGYDVTNSNWARNRLKLEYGLRGLIPDGALFRVSTLNVPPDRAAALEEKFIRDLLGSVPPDTRAFLVGEPSKALL